jgi:hypothetical protein
LIRPLYLRTDRSHAPYRGEKFQDANANLIFLQSIRIL